MERNHRNGILIGVVLGMIFGFLWQFRIFRLMIFTMLTTLGLMYLWDHVVTETTLPSSASGYQYIARARVTGGPDLFQSRQDLAYNVQLSMGNRHYRTIDRFVLQSTLYDCATPQLALQSCQLVKTQGRVVQISLPSGKFWTNNVKILFDNAPEVTGYPRATFEIKDVVTDWDDQGDAVRDEERRVALARWNAL